MHNYLQKIHSIIFYIFVFMLPWQCLWLWREIFFNSEKWQYGTIGIYISDIVLIFWLFLSIYLYKNLIVKYFSKKQKLLFLPFLIIFWTFLSILWADDKLLAFYFALKLSFAFDLFFLIKILPLKIRSIGFAFILSAFIQSIIGFYQFIWQTTFAQKFLGLQLHHIWQGGTAIINSPDGRWLRSYGAMPHPNIFAGLLLIALLLAIYLYISTARNKLFVRLFLLFSIILFTTNVLFTFSRTIWLLLFISIITILIKINSVQRKKIIAPLSLIVVTIIFIISTYQNLFFSRLVQDTSFSHNSVNERSLYIQQAKKIILQKPLLGVGGGNYTLIVYKKDFSIYPIWYYQPVHNVFLLILAELGIVGLILFLLFLIQTLMKTSPQLRFLLVILYFLFFFDHWLWTSHFGLFLLFLILGMLSRKKI